MIHCLHSEVINHLCFNSFEFCAKLGSYHCLESENSRAEYENN